MFWSEAMCIVGLRLFSSRAPDWFLGRSQPPEVLSLSALSGAFHLTRSKLFTCRGSENGQPRIESHINSLPEFLGITFGSGPFWWLQRMFGYCFGPIRSLGSETPHLWRLQRAPVSAASDPGGGPGRGGSVRTCSACGLSIAIWCLEFVYGRVTFGKARSWTMEG